MPFYLRKSISAGPFRFNLSKSGVGVSVGVKGLRIGTGPHGHYVHAGRGGLYYRASLGGTRNSPAPRHASPAPSRTAGYAEQSRVTMTEIKSGDVAAMRDATVGDLVDDLNKMQAKIPLGISAACCLALIGVIALFRHESGLTSTRDIGIFILLAVFPAWAIGTWFDSYRRTSVLYYNLEGATESAYRNFTESFDSLNACRGKWHIASGGAVRDLTTWKRNAGADHLVDRKAARLGYHLPKVLRSNITPPAITLRDRTFFFFPEMMIVKHGSRFGAVDYDDLQIGSQTSRFIEEGMPPADAQVVDHTWSHPNKGGGPDRRFRNNRQLPVCLYDVMHLFSKTGVNEIMEFSRTGLVQPFSMALHQLPHRQSPEGIGDIIRLSSVATPERDDVIIPASPTHRSPDWKLLTGAAVLISAVAAVTTYALHNSRTSPRSDGPFAELQSVPTIGATESQAPLAVAMPQARPEASVQPIPSPPTVTVKMPANIRSGPSTSAAVIRVAGAGEKLQIFGRTNGWVQIGTDKPLGWIASSLVTE